ncbi:MAG: hypothetical protein KDC95_12010 [Planctomycetes bacterium]|nr:hypothetical protein [Planctomycetota bacterium]
MTARVARYGFALLPIVAVLWIVVVFRGLGPEPTAFREAWSDAPFLHTRATFFDFGHRPRFFAFEGLRWLATRFGPDFDVLAFVPFVTVAFALVVLLALLRRLRAGSGLTVFVVAALLFSSRFGANWICFERVRMFLPLAAGVCAVAVLVSWRRFIAAYWFAFACVIVATTSHRSGALMWLALLPLVMDRARRRSESLGPEGRGSTIRSVVAWILGGNAVTLLVYGGVHRDKPGLAGTFFQDPLHAVDTILQLASATLPDVLPRTLVDERVFGAVLLTGFFGILLFTLFRGSRSGRERLPELSLAACGVVAIVAVAHERIAAGFFGNMLAECCPAGSLLLIGLLLTARSWAHGTDRAHHFVRMLTVASASVFVVVLTQGWARDVAALRVVHTLLRQTEASLVLADAGDLELAQQPCVASGVERAELRASGKLRRLPAKASLAIVRFQGVNDEVATTGSMEQIASRAASGSALDADLVLLVRSSTGEVFATAAPQPAIETSTPRPWVALFELEKPFTRDEVVRAYAFDVRRDLVRPLAGIHVFDGSGFRSSSEGGR